MLSYKKQMADGNLRQRHERISKSKRNGTNIIRDGVTVRMYLMARATKAIVRWSSGSSFAAGFGKPFEQSTT